MKTTRFEDFVSSGSFVKRVRRIDARLSSSMKGISRLAAEQLCNVREAFNLRESQVWRGTCSRASRSPCDQTLHSDEFEDTVLARGLAVTREMLGGLDYIPYRVTWSRTSVIVLQTSGLEANN
jgi:hypothetical protein